MRGGGREEKGENMVVSGMLCPCREGILEKVIVCRCLSHMDEFMRKEGVMDLL